MSDLTPTPVDDAACYARTVSLVRAARGGDQTARDSIFERYLPRVAEMVSLYLGRRLRTFVDVNPVSLMATALRGLMSGSTDLGQIGLALIAPVALTVILAPVTLWIYLRR